MGKNQTGLGPTRFRVILVMPPSEFLETEQPDFGKSEPTELLDEISLGKQTHPWGSRMRLSLDAVGILPKKGNEDSGT